MVMAIPLDKLFHPDMYVIKNNWYQIFLFPCFSANFIEL